MRRELLEDEYVICRNQGNIYEFMAAQGYDMNLFSDLYLKSDWCKRAMDTVYSRFQWADTLECLDFIFPEIYKNLKKYDDNLIYDPDVARWIGFQYRYLYCVSGIESRRLAELFNFKSLERQYCGLHTIDEYMATCILLDSLES